MATSQEAEAPVVVDEGVVEMQKADEANVAGQDEIENYDMKRALKFDVWKNFKKVMVYGQKMIKCIHCDMTFVVPKSGTTSQFKRHMEGSCPHRFKGKGQQERTTVKNVTKKGEDVVAVGNFKYDREKVKKLLAKLVIMDERPFKSVESKLFNMFCKYLQPRHEKFSRNTIKNECMKLYGEEKEKLKRMLSKIENISITSDCWTSRVPKHYMSLTVHYIDDDWKLQKRLLSFRIFPPAHIATNMASLMTLLLLEWGIEGKVFTITLDNATVNDKMVEILKVGFPSTVYKIRESILHVRCCAHILNLIVKDGLVHIKDVIENVRQSIKYIKGSISRTTDFETALSQANLTGKKGLTLDVSTRWNSTYLMLKGAREVKLAFIIYKGMDLNYRWCPSDQDWEKYVELEDVLEVFFKATELFSGSKYPTSNLFLPALYKIKDKLFTTSLGATGKTKSMIESMHAKFEKYWNDCNLVLGIACVLDPRYKMSMVKFAFKNVYKLGGSNKIFEHVKKVQDALEELYAFYEEKMQTRSWETMEIGTSSHSMGTHNMDFDDEYSKFVEEEEQIKTNKSELEAYLGDPKAPNRPQFDVLEFWKIASVNYPLLSVMARDVLAVPLTTVTSESAFSAGNRVVSDNHSSLNSETIEALMCTQDWLRPLYGEGLGDENDDA